MTTPDLRSLAQALAVSLRGSRTEGQPLVLLPTLLRLLARGEPVSPIEIAEGAGVSEAEVHTRLAASPDAELDDDGNLVGMGLTLRPTPHRFRLDGGDLYTWCALDTLMYPSLLETSAVVESPCRGTGDPVRVEVGPEGVRSVDPTDAVVSIVVPEECRSVRATFCDQVHFFRSAEAANDWLRARPNAIVLSVREAFQLGRLLHEVSLGAPPDPRVRAGVPPRL